MSIEVRAGGERFVVARAVFTALLDNSVVHAHADYLRALDSGHISLSELQKLARTAHIPWCLFFASPQVVERQVELNTQKLLQGVGKDTFSLSSRATIDIRDVELLVKDLVRKQQLVKQHGGPLEENSIVGLLRRPRNTPEEDGDLLLEALELDRASIHGRCSKRRALQRFIRALEAKQVLVSQSATGYMPQRLSGIKFSGLAVRDKKVPYIFLAGGDHGEHSEPTGRQLFTLVLMAVLVARGVFTPVTYNGEALAVAAPREYGVVAHILMPASLVGNHDLATLDGVRRASDHFNVTPSAMVVRGAHLQRIPRDVADRYLSELADEFSRRPKPFIPHLKPAKGVLKYTGRELSVRMLDALDAGRIGKSEFCRQVALNKLKPREIDDLRVVVQ